MRRTAAAAAVALAAMLAGSACPKPVHKTDQSQTDSRTHGQGDRGGTLRLIATTDADTTLSLDPTAATDPGAWSLLRALTRQLMTFPPGPPGGKDPVPDVAAAPPDVSDDGLVYTFTLRADVRYAPPRKAAVQAGDFVIGIKRSCDPNTDSDNAGLFTELIDGMRPFCDGLLAVPKGDPAAVARYIQSNDVPGLSAPSPTRLVVRLTRPSGDLVYLLATPFASPIPADALTVKDNSPEFLTRFPASGPYAVGSYNPHQRLRLVRNGNQPDGDPNRHAYADVIEIGLNASDNAGSVLAIRSDAADLAWRTAPPADEVAKAEGDHDPLLHTASNGCMNYLVLNQRRAALSLLSVRQALNLAVDKPMLVDGIAGFPGGGTPRGGFLPSTQAGFAGTDPYATPGSHGDATRAQQVLAGMAPVALDFMYPLPLVEMPDGTTRYADPATLPPETEDQAPFTGVVDTGPPARWPALAKQFAAAMSRAGFDVHLHPVPANEIYIKHLNPGGANDWDVAPVTWCPDWPGLGGRTLFAALLDARPAVNGLDLGGYDSAAADRLADTAAAERDPAKAAELWQKVDEQVMADAAIVPLGEETTAAFVGKRVADWSHSAFLPAGDLPNIRLTR
jgi:peptide/nickel transport system substrate-binding protein